MSVIDQIDKGEICLAIGTRSGLAVSPQKELREELLSLARIGERMRWVPVSDRFPEAGQVVDVYTISKGRVADVEWSGSEWASQWFNDVTHWMPLPEPPMTGV